MRDRRWQTMLEVFPRLRDMRVLDLGGTPDTWMLHDVRPASVTLLNSTSSEMDLTSTSDGFDVVIGDACNPPDSVRNATFDLVFSNSVIEHVGGAHRRREFAEFVSRSAPHYWIQTPYRYFPVEPHWLCPGFQFLPLPARARLSRIWPLMHTRSHSRSESVATALAVELIGKTELRHLFPDAEIRAERLLGLTKSLVAIRP